MYPQDAVSPRSGVVVEFPHRHRAPEAPVVSVRHRRAGHWTVIEIAGEMDLQAVSLMPKLTPKRAARVVFELGGVTFMDAGGLGLLAGSQRRAVAAGGEVRLVAPSPAALRLLEITGADHAFPTFDSVDAAVAPRV